MSSMSTGAPLPTHIHQLFLHAPRVSCILDKYTLIFQTSQRTSRCHTYVKHQDIIQYREKNSKLLATAGREGGVFVVCCIIECGKIKNSNYQQAYMLWGKWLNKKLSLVGDMTAELVFDSGNWSQNDATWEKNNPGLLY